MKPFNWLLILIVLFAGCKKKENFDPCAGRHTTSADFKIEEQVGDRYFEGDTVAGGNFERFTAKYPADSFVWILGSEIIKGSSFERRGYPPNSWITVKCIAYKKPDFA